MKIFLIIVTIAGGIKKQGWRNQKQCWKQRELEVAVKEDCVMMGRPIEKWRRELTESKGCKAADLIVSINLSTFFYFDFQVVKILIKAATRKRKQCWKQPEHELAVKEDSIRMEQPLEERKTALTESKWYKVADLVIVGMNLCTPFFL